MKQCVVHIGAPKTGTTALQKLLCEHRDKLLDQGWLYPAVSLRGWGHHDLAFLSAGGYPDWATGQARGLDELVAELAAQARAHPGHVLLSSENFYLCDRPEGLHQLLEQAGLLEGRRLRLLVYLREQVGAHESWYNQTLKAQGYTHSVTDCVQQFDALWDYRSKLERWAAVFGADSLCPRVYERSQFVGGNLAADFAQQLGLAIGGWHQSEQLVNTSLNRDALEFQRLLNALPLDHAERRRFHKELIELSDRTRELDLFSQEPVIDAELAAAIQARYALGNQAVALRHFGREQLFLSPPPRRGSGYAGLQQDNLVRLMGWLMIRAGSKS